MRFLSRSVLWMAAALCGVGQAHGQFVSVYGLFNPVHASNVQTGTVSSGGTTTNQTTSFWAPAFGGGVTLNFLSLPVVKLGLDVRGSTRPGTTGADTAQVGLRLGIRPPLLRLRPYVQGGIGYLQTRTVNVSTTPGNSTPIGGTFTNNFATYGVQAGVDKPLMPFLDFRVVEFGVTHAFNASLHAGNNNATTFSIATGLVAHF